MIKDVFKFKKTAWHMRLMNYIWGFQPHDFRNMCPYFWLSVFNVIVGIPIIVPFKYINKQLDKAVSSIGTTIENLLTGYRERCRQEEEKFRQKLTEDLKAIKDGKPAAEDEDWWDVYYRSEYLTPGSPYYKSASKKLRNAIRESFHSDLDLYRSRFDAIEKYREMYSKLEAEREAANRLIETKKLERQKQTAVRIGQLTVMFKKFFTGVAIVLATAVILGIIWGLYLLGGLLLTVDWFKVLHYILLGAGVLIMAAAIVIAVYLIIRLLGYLWCQFGEYCIPCEKRRVFIGRVLASILFAVAFPFVNIFPAVWSDHNKPPVLGPVSWIVVQIWKGFVFIFQILKALKDNNCPAVDWED